MQKILEASQDTGVSNSNTIGVLFVKTLQYFWNKLFLSLGTE